MSFQLSIYLKEGTKQTHDQAETSNFQRRLASADISRTAYTDYMGQLYLVHSALEDRLAGDAKTNELVDAAEFQAEFLSRDLQVLSAEIDKIKPRTATKRMLTQIEQKSKGNPIGLLGYHYVLLGSKHGGKYMAAVIRKKFDFDGAGCLYFDPYGTNFQGIWQQFKTKLDCAAADESEGEPVLQAAREMFEYFGALGTELSTLD